MQVAMTIHDLSKHEIQQRIDRVHWYHEFDFGNGLRTQANTPDAQSHRALWRFIRGELDKIDFAQKTVLDIGCWDGFWSFYAEQRGATKVLATDDTSQNWAGGAGFELARELLRSSIDYELRQSVYELTNLQRRFDIILCLGVFYHLFDPYYAFTQIRHCCQENAIVVFEGDVVFGLLELQARSAALYSRDVRKAPRFVPDPDTLRFLINSAYFSILDEAVFPLTATTIEGHPPPGVNRMLLVCRPFRGETNVMNILPHLDYNSTMFATACLRSNGQPSIWVTRMSKDDQRQDHPRVARSPAAGSRAPGWRRADPPSHRTGATRPV
jgi:tRNA (mo5U34)-methyltransferase